MSLVERLEQKAKTREEIRVETRELKRTYDTDGCYNPFNLVNSEVQRRLNQKAVWLDDVQATVKQATTHNNFMDFVHSKYRLRDVECMDFTFDEMMELVNEWLDTVLVGGQTEQKKE